MDKVIAILKEQEAHYGLSAALKTKRQKEYQSAVEEIQLAVQILQLNKHDVSGRSEQLPCEHLPMIDTGVGYYHCPACGWSKKLDGNCH